MSYVKQVLQPEEKLRHVASVHWVVYLPGAVLAVAALVLFVYSEFGTDRHMLWKWAAALVGLAAVYFVAREWFTWWATEIAVTNHRVIFKTGFIRRHTNEMNMEKVESVKVDQSVMGRILDYGDVTITGTGESLENLKTVAAPISLRNHITGV